MTISLHQFKSKIKDLYENEKMPAIFKKGNVYYVFGKYNIVEKDDVYELYRHGSYVDYVNSTRTAMMWCVADKQVNVLLAKDLLKYDHEISSRQFDVLVHKRLADIGTYEQKKLHCDLYYENIDRLKVLQRKLANCVFQAKYNKIKDFEQ